MIEDRSTVAHPDAASDETEREGLVPVGQFSADGDPARWVVWWDPQTHEVLADRLLERRPGATLGSPQFLGSVPHFSYVVDVLAAIDHAHGSTSWRTTRGIQPLRHWIARVSAALDGATPGAYAAAVDGPVPHYLDRGHRLEMVDAIAASLDSSELYDDVNEQLQRARSSLESLACTIAERGNLAQAATDAQTLVESTICMHLALGDAYSLAHRSLRAPTDEPGHDRTTEPTTADPDWKRISETPQAPTR